MSMKDVDGPCMPTNDVSREVDRSCMSMSEVDWEVRLGKNVPRDTGVHGMTGRHLGMKQRMTIITSYVLSLDNTLAYEFASLQCVVNQSTKACTDGIEDVKTIELLILQLIKRNILLP
jgi:hypothetical protein